MIFLAGSQRQPRQDRNTTDSCVASGISPNTWQVDEGGASAAAQDKEALHMQRSTVNQKHTWVAKDSILSVLPV
jgi:hypothetical protein